MEYMDEGGHDLALLMRGLFVFFLCHFVTLCLAEHVNVGKWTGGYLGLGFL